MKAYKQFYRHDPDNGIYGDCYRTAFACLLEVNPGAVPHFAEGGTDDFWDRVNAFLERKRLVLIQVPFTGDNVAAITQTVGAFNPDLDYLLTGTSRTGVGHTVVCHGTHIVHDPSLDDSGIVGPLPAEEGLDGSVPHYVVEFLVRPL